VIHRGTNFADIYRNAKGSTLQYADMVYMGAPPPTLPTLSKTELRRLFVRDFVKFLDVFTCATRDG